MEMDYLARRLHFVPTLAQWHHQEWAYLRPGDSVEQRIARLRAAAADRAAIPTVVVAVTDAELLGSAMLVANDMDTRPHLSPWLAGVYVAPQHRRQGLGAALVGRIIRDAQTLGVRCLYLYTPIAESFYRRLGWSVVERTRYRGIDVVIMSLDCES